MTAIYSGEALRLPENPMRYFSGWKSLLSLLWLGAGLWVNAGAQPPAEAELAGKYFNEGEYASALELYLKVNRRDYVELYTQRIVACYEALGQYSEAIDYLEKAEKRQSERLLYPVLRASLLEKKGDLKAAENLYEEVIRKRLRGEGDFIQIGAFLYQAGKLDLALKTYETGRKSLRDPFLFCNEIANIHTNQGDYKAATLEYVNLYLRSVEDLSSANLAILNMVGPLTQEPIEQALLQAVDKRQSDLGLRTILYEFYVLAQNFDEAFIQVRSIDRLYREDGRRVYEFALTMRNNQRFALSNRALDYIIDRRENSPYYFRAHFEKATNGELQAFARIPVDMASVQQAVADYGRLLDEFGRRPQYFDAIYRRAYLMIFYLDQLEPGQQELEQVVRQPHTMSQENWAKAKLLIGDVHLMQADYNRAKLTYTEVSERFVDRQLGALAKYKLAQLAYYKGEFNLAQALLGAIKENTSNDISNDAIKLNLLIIDNTGLDTTTTALEIFAQAQLRTYQRNYSAALAKLDSLAERFPVHALADEILWEKANIFLRQNNIETAMTYLDRILNEFGTDIYGDDALYTKARIYDYTLNNPEEAMTYYLDFLVRFPGSLFSVEVRKRIRELRQG